MLIVLRLHLSSQAGIIAGSKAGDQRATDTRDDEKERGITIKSTAISMYFELEEENVSLVQQKVDGTAQPARGTITVRQRAHRFLAFVMCRTRVPDQPD